MRCGFALCVTVCILCGWLSVNCCCVTASEVFGEVVVLVYFC